MIYEIAIRCVDGDLVWWQDDYADFHAACQAGLDGTSNTHPLNRKTYDARLVSVTEIQ